LRGRSRTKSKVGRLRFGVQRSGRIPASGRIGLPEIEVVELARGRDPRVVRLEPPTRRWWGSLVDRGRFVLEPNSFVLLEIVEDLASELGQPRCVLRVRPGMAGEVVIGVARMSVGQILADPALRQPDGRARLPLPNGSRVRIVAQGMTFLARVGGPPLLRPTRAADPIPDAALEPAF
jgi:hypothetical protein